MKIYISRMVNVMTIFQVLILMTCLFISPSVSAQTAPNSDDPTYFLKSVFADEKMHYKVLYQVEEFQFGQPSDVYQNEINQTRETPCPDRFFCNQTTKTMTPCPPGYYCRDSSIRMCSEGNYCPLGSQNETKCGFFSTILFPCLDGAEYQNLLPSIVFWLLLCLCSMLSIPMCFMLIYKVSFRCLKSFKYDASKPSKSGTIKCQNVCFTSSSGEKILTGITCEFSTGLNPIMGQSGCGKTTFLTCIGGRNDAGEITGEITLPNGISQYSLGYVPQDDTMHTFLTVEENLVFSSIFQNGLVITIAADVDKAIERLLLGPKRGDLIGDVTESALSGGEKKRVNVAIELVRNCNTILMDEPFSGLDAAITENLVETLMEIGKTATIVMIIHSPSEKVMKSFYNLLYLRKGQDPWKGTPGDDDYKLIQDVEKLPEICWDQINDKAIIDSLKIQKKQRANLRNTSLSDDVQVTGGIVGIPFAIFRFISQFVGNLVRTQILQARQYRRATLDFLLSCFIAALLGSLFSRVLYIGPPSERDAAKCGDFQYRCELPVKDQILVYFAFINLSIVFLGALNGLKVFGEEKEIFKRETFSGLNSLAYFLSKDWCMTYMNIIVPLGFTVIFTHMTGLRSNFFSVFLIMFLQYWCAAAIGYMVSFLFTRKDYATVLLVCVCVVCTFISGSMISLKEFDNLGFPFEWLPPISILRYSLESLYFLELREYSYFYSIEKSISISGYSKDSYTKNAWILVAFGISFRVLSYALLYIMSRPNNSRVWYIYQKASYIIMGALSTFSRGLLKRFIILVSGLFYIVDYRDEVLAFLVEKTSSKVKSVNDDILEQILDDGDDVGDQNNVKFINILCKWIFIVFCGCLLAMVGVFVMYAFFMTGRRFCRPSIETTNTNGTFFLGNTTFHMASGGSTCHMSVSGNFVTIFDGEHNYFRYIVKHITPKVDILDTWWEPERKFNFQCKELSYTQYRYNIKRSGKSQTLFPIDCKTLEFDYNFCDDMIYRRPTHYPVQIHFDIVYDFRLWNWVFPTNVKLSQPSIYLRGTVPNS